MDLRDLIQLLGDGCYHSGEELGERFGVSRTAIWKQLKKLETLGLSLDAVRGKGYCLLPPVELLDGGKIVGALPLEARRRLQRLFVEMQIDSTNTFLLERFKQGAGHGEVCFAERQTSGRGRRGRAWQSSLGAGLTFSMGWRFNIPAAKLQGLSLGVGVAVADALAEFGVKVELKWPNDVLMRRHEGQLAKLGGVLVELQGDAEGPCDVVVGIGLNVFAAPEVAQGVGLPGGYIAELATTPVSRNALSAVLIDCLGILLESFESEGFSAVAQRWNDLNALLDEEVNVFRGKETFTAVVRGVDTDGGLMIERNGVADVLAGGEITVRPVEKQ